MAKTTSVLSLVLPFCLALLISNGLARELQQNNCHTVVHQGNPFSYSWTCGDDGTGEGAGDLPPPGNSGNPHPGNPPSSSNPGLPDVPPATGGGGFPGMGGSGFPGMGGGFPGMPGFPPNAGPPNGYETLPLCMQDWFKQFQGWLINPTSPMPIPQCLPNPNPNGPPKV